MIQLNYTAIDLHKAAQEATRCGMHELAYCLLTEAAGYALTPEGRIVLLEKALDAAFRCERRGDMPQRMH